jgi:glycosyltransferase involved in cell wall biosynthesis
VDPSSGVFVFNRLKAMGRLADVRVLQPIPYFPMVRPVPDWLDDQGSDTAEAPVSRIPMAYLPGVFKSLDGIWLARAVRSGVEKLAKSDGVDLIDAHFGYPEGVGCFRVAERMQIPLFVTVRGFETEFLGRCLIGSQIRRALLGARGIVCVSHSLRILLEDLGIPSERIAVIHNGIGAQTFKPGDKLAARSTLGIPLDKPLIVSVGHQVRRKRHHLLMEAFAGIRRDRPSALLAIIGAESFETDYPARLRKQVHDLGLTDCVRFAGNIPPSQLAQWLRAADVFALATAREGCCNAVLEALATGVPVVTTPAGDKAFFVKEGLDGYLVPIDDAAALRVGIDHALQARGWDSAAIAARLNAQAGDWDAVASRVIAFFESALERGGG